MSLGIWSSAGTRGARHGAQRDVLPERHRVGLVVVAPRLPGRRPDDRPVVPAAARPVPHDRAHQQRRTDARGASPMAALGAGVGVGVDVGGVLRPDHQVGLRRLRRRRPAGELEGRVDVVVEHGPALGERLEALAGDVALDRGHATVARAAGDRVRPAGVERHQRGEAGQERRGREADHRPHRRTARPQHRPGQGRPHQGHQERHARRADVGERRGEGGVLGRERQPAPREAAERHHAAQRLDEHPAGGGPHRPPGSRRTARVARPASP